MGSVAEEAEEAEEGELSESTFIFCVFSRDDEPATKAKEQLLSSIRHTFHMHPSHSIGWLHMHNFVDSLRTKAYDEQEDHARELGMLKNVDTKVVEETLIRRLPHLKALVERVRKSAVFDLETELDREKIEKAASLNVFGDSFAHPEQVEILRQMENMQAGVATMAQDATNMAQKLEKMAAPQEEAGSSISNQKIQTKQMHRRKSMS